MARPSRCSRARRPAVAFVAAVFALAACGDAGDDASPSDPAGGSDTTVDADGGAGGAGGASDGATDASAVATTVAGEPSTTDDPAAAPPTGKPEVAIPDEVPTELVVTDLIVGSGPEADVGDTVTVHYVGVRTVDGVEFDNSYDRGTPFPLVLGTGSVIQGWDQGLIGVQAGTRRQLDIPAELAYGDIARSDVIRANEALTFVVDVISVEKRPAPVVPPMADPADCPATDGSEAQQQEFTEMQPFCIDVTKTYTAEVTTNFGSFTIALDPAAAPQNVNNFVTLARYKYFDGTECHRVLTDFVVQCGDPDASGFGGPGYTIPDELPLPGEYEVGSIAMANTGRPDSAGSQFFIISGPQGASLPPQYSLFGQVGDGFPVISELNTLENPNGDNGTPPLETITIESITITEA